MSTSITTIVRIVIVVTGLMPNATVAIRDVQDRYLAIYWPDPENRTCTDIPEVNPVVADREGRIFTCVPIRRGWKISVQPVQGAK